MSKAISLNDSLLATQEEKKIDPVFKEILAKHSITPIGRKSVIFKLRNAPNGKVHLDGIDDVYDEETQNMRRMRLLKGISEIWQDKQEKIDKDYVNKNRISLTFIQGGLILDEVKDAALIKFARKSNCNEGNPYRIPGKKRAFYEWDPIAQEREAFEKEMAEIKVVELAMATPIEKAKKHALYLGVPIHDEVGNIRSEQGIRVLYVRKAKENPKRFEETLDSPEVEIKYLIRRAIADSKIEVRGTNAQWTAGGFISKIPHSKETVDYLVEFAMLSTDESKSFVDRLQKMAI